MAERLMGSFTNTSYFFLSLAERYLIVSWGRWWWQWFNTSGPSSPIWNHMVLTVQKHTEKQAFIWRLYCSRPQPCSNSVPYLFSLICLKLNTDKYLPDWNTNGQNRQKNEKGEELSSFHSCPDLLALSLSVHKASINHSWSGSDVSCWASSRAQIED